MGSVLLQCPGPCLQAFGKARQLVGIEAVLANGGVIRRLDGLEKDNTGYDLASLLCGSEGTLGVITAARFRLHPPPSRFESWFPGLAHDDAAVERTLDAIAEALVTTGGGEG